MLTTNCIGSVDHEHLQDLHVGLDWLLSCTDLLYTLSYCSHADHWVVANVRRECFVDWIGWMDIPSLYFAGGANIPTQLRVVELINVYKCEAYGLIS